MLKNQNIKAKQISLALGGGGARGFAHLGVLQILEENHFEISSIVGTSMGALIGGIYAQLGDAQATIAHVKSKMDEINNFTFASRQDAFFNALSIQFRDEILLNGAPPDAADKMSAQLQNAICVLLQDTNIQHTRIAFAAIASDAITGKETILQSGSIRQAVLASSALPGIMKPVAWEDKLLIDGAATSAVPIRAARKISSTPVFASDVSAALVPRQNFNSAIELYVRNLQIVSRHYHDELVREADLLIEPQVGERAWNDFTQLDWFIEQGRIAATSALQRYGDNI